MRCGSCGTENESTRKFCGECGGAPARLLGDEPRWRQELLEAQAVYREIGAPAQVEWLERELAPD